LTQPTVNYQKGPRANSEPVRNVPGNKLVVNVQFLMPAPLKHVTYSGILYCLYCLGVSPYPPPHKEGFRHGPVVLLNDPTLGDLLNQLDEALLLQLLYVIVKLSVGLTKALSQLIDGCRPFNQMLKNLHPPLARKGLDGAGLLDYNPVLHKATPLPLPAGPF